MSLKIILLEVLPHFPGAKELKAFDCQILTCYMLKCEWRKIDMYMDLHHCQSLTMAWLRLLNSLGPRDAIRRCRSGPTLGQVMACCLTAPSHYLTQYWLIIRRPSDFHLRSISREIPQPQTPTIRLKIPYLNFQSNLQGGNELTHWGQNKMVATLQTTSWNAFSRMKTLEFQMIFHWNMSIQLNSQYVSIGSDNGLALNRSQAIV